MSDKREYIRFDWAIKRILRDKTNKEVLEGLIQVLIKEPVTITEILESENNKDRREDKGNRVDVKARTGKGEIRQHPLLQLRLWRRLCFPWRYHLPRHD